MWFISIYSGSSVQLSTLMLNTAHVLLLTLNLRMLCIRLACQVIPPEIKKYCSY